jgi:TonB family protein
LSAGFVLGAHVAAQSGTASLQGVVFDPTNRLVPDASLTLSDRAGEQGARQTTTDGQGRYQFSGLVPGPYRLEVTRPGFRTATSEVQVAGDAEQNFRLAVGSLRESISVMPGSGDRESPPGPAALERSDRRRSEYDAAVAKQCAGRRVGRVGGLIVAPMKVAHVNPQYPADMAKAHLGGSIGLRATLGTDGSVSSISVATEGHRAFIDATAEAVRQWRFLPVMLNCEPIAVEMQVVATFMPNR